MLTARSVALISLFTLHVRSCFIQGQDSGDCRTLEDLTSGPTPDLSYCGSVLKYGSGSVCVPRSYGGENMDFVSTLPVIYGIFTNHTVKKKDKWISDFVANTVARRTLIETTNGDAPGLRELGGSVLTDEVRCAEKRERRGARKKY